MFYVCFTYVLRMFYVCFTYVLQVCFTDVLQPRKTSVKHPFLVTEAVVGAFLAGCQQMPKLADMHRHTPTFWIPRTRHCPIYFALLCTKGSKDGWRQGRRSKGEEGVDMKVCVCSFWHARSRSAQGGNCVATFWPTAGGNGNII
jgi:hypothetical protein